MTLPEPQSVTFSSLFAEIEYGTIKIPQFQRDFVWSKTDSAKLLDSIVKGYPIGTFILWKTNERLRSIRNLGGLTLPDTPKGDAVKYVLDGQQRLTSLFVTLKGLSIKREDRMDDFSQVWVDLAVDEDQEIILTDIEGRNPCEIIQLKDLLLGDFAYLASFQPEFQQKIRTYKNRVESYQFSAILMNNSYWRHECVRRYGATDSSTITIIRDIVVSCLTAARLSIRWVPSDSLTGKKLYPLATLSSRTANREATSRANVSFAEMSPLVVADSLSLTNSPRTPSSESLSIAAIEAPCFFAAASNVS